MKLIFSFFVVISVFVASFLYYQNKKMERLEQEVIELRNKNVQFKDAMEYLIDKELEGDTPLNYKEWKRKQKVANKLVDRSDGKFKKEWSLFLIDMTDRYDIDPYLVYELLHVETGGKFDPDLTGPETKYGQAYGLSQFMKNTAPWIAEMGGLNYKDELLFDPYYSIQLSVVYLDFLRNRYEGDWNRALTAYHRGMYGLEKYVKENGHAKSWYSKQIISKSKEGRLVAYNE